MNSYDWPETSLCTRRPGLVFGVCRWTADRTCPMPAATRSYFCPAESRPSIRNRPWASVTATRR